MEQAFLSVLLGLGLSAACGFRVFVPLLIINLAARGGILSLSPGFAWMGDTAALIAFAVATVLEIVAYYVPWLDNLLDAVAAPAAIVAGVVATAAVVTGMEPTLKFILAVIAGGGIAGAVQAATTGGRQVSSLLTGGLGNPLVATAELFGSLGLSLLSIAAPLVAGVVVLVVLMLAMRRMWRRRATGRSEAPSGG
jgi:hypothetical protein